MKLTLLGVDPGIRDTGAVALVLDFDNRKWNVVAKAWHGVTTNHGFNVVTDEEFLDEIAEFEQNLRGNGPLFSGVEAYRQRGMDVRQDQQMINLVQDIRATVRGCKIVDNTGIKKVVTRDMLKLFGVARFRQATNHADLVSAARVALMRGIAEDGTNPLLSDFIHDNAVAMGERTWSLESTQIL
ncbi:hypothetical protein SEA_FEDE_8 [Microbacterium phage Fede]|nr:hypothetical protein SEA_FEDE_8 [Microbacterium phage Fede]